MDTWRASSTMDGLPQTQARRQSSGILDYARQVLAIAIFFGAGLIVSPLCWLAHKAGGTFLPASTGQHILRTFFRFFTWWMRMTGLLEIRVRGLDKLRRREGTIFVANHPALIDAVFLVAHLPLTACVMRAGLLSNPAMCGAALLAGYVTNDSGPAFVRQGIEKIRGGGNLLIFPEGTRTVEAPVSRFKNGFALVATRTGAPVQSILIRYCGPYITKGVPLFSPAPLPLRFEISAGELFEPRPSETARALSRRIESWFHSELEAPSPRA